MSPSNNGASSTDIIGFVRLGITRMARAIIIAVIAAIVRVALAAVCIVARLITRVGTVAR